MGDVFQPRGCYYKFRDTSQSKSYCVFYNIKVMGNVSYRILKICIDNTSFTNSLIQNSGMADPNFYLPTKKTYIYHVGFKLNKNS